MSRGRCTGVIGLVLVLVACCGPGKSQGVRLDAQAPSRAAGRYPAIFLHPPGGPAGIGFSPLGRYSCDSSYAHAAGMACRLLAWSTHVRVRGERLFQRLPGGDLEFRGEHIDLLELPETAPESCRLETLAVAGRAWILALPEKGPEAAWGAMETFSRKPPSWIEVPRRDPGWRYAMGTASVSIKDEAGSWEVATYRALVELAVSVASRTENLRKQLDAATSGATRVIFDTELRGFCVTGRWSDGKNLYVLGAVPASGARPRLGMDE